MTEEYQRALSTLGASGHDQVDYIFKLCVILLVDLASWLGISYEELNVWLFVIVLPVALVWQTIWIIILRFNLKKAQRALLDSAAS